MEKEEIRVEDADILGLGTILNQLPKPRMESLGTLALAYALDQFETDREAAEFLGISTRMMSHKKKQLTEKMKGEPKWLEKING